MAYRQLSYDDRVRIYILRKEGYSMRRIAKLLGVDPSTVNRKLQAQFFFAHPYAAWEQGLNENTNDLFR